MEFTLESTVTESPIAVFTAAAEAYYGANWTRVAALCDAASLELFKRDVLNQHASHLQLLSQWGVDDVMSKAPHLTREEAKERVAKLRRQLALSNALQRQGRGIETMEEVEASAPDDVFAAYLEAHEFRNVVDLLESTGELKPELAAQILRFQPAVNPYVVLGAVPDGEVLAHVVYHDTSGELPDEEREDELALVRDYWRDMHGKREPQVSTCRRQSDGTWRVIAERWLFSCGSLLISGAAAAEGDETT